MATKLPGWLKFAGWVCGIGVLLLIGLVVGSWFGV